MAGNRNYHDQVIVDNQIKSLENFKNSYQSSAQSFSVVLSLLLHPEQE